MKHLDILYIASVHYCILAHLTCRDFRHFSDQLRFAFVRFYCMRQSLPLPQTSVPALLWSSECTRCRKTSVEVLEEKMDVNFISLAALGVI